VRNDVLVVSAKPVVAARCIMWLDNSHIMEFIVTFIS
jgi:hypothetical protein